MNFNSLLSTLPLNYDEAAFLPNEFNLKAANQGTWLAHNMENNDQYLFYHVWINYNTKGKYLRC